MSTTIIPTIIKHSPFLLSDDILDRLITTAHEPAVGDLVGTYRRTRADYLECLAMVSDELEYFHVT